MEILYLSKESLDEENIMKIITFVRECEKENGLSDEEIDYKYTHGYCGKLARLIKLIFEKCLNKTIYIKTFNTSLELSDEVVHNTHLYISPRVSFQLRPGVSAKDSLIRYYYDILGKKTEDEVQQFLASDYYLYENARYEQVFDKEIKNKSFDKIKQLAQDNIRLNENEIEMR